MTNDPLSSRTAIHPNPATRNPARVAHPRRHPRPMSTATSTGTNRATARITARALPTSKVASSNTERPRSPARGGPTMAVHPPSPSSSSSHGRLSTTAPPAATPPAMASRIGASTGAPVSSVATAIRTGDEHQHHRVRGFERGDDRGDEHAAGEQLHMAPGTEADGSLTDLVPAVRDRARRSCAARRSTTASLRRSAAHPIGPSRRADRAGAPATYTIVAARRALVVLNAPDSRQMPTAPMSIGVTIARVCSNPMRNSVATLAIEMSARPVGEAPVRPRPWGFQPDVYWSSSRRGLSPNGRNCPNDGTPPVSNSRDPMTTIDTIAIQPIAADAPARSRHARPVPRCASGRASRDLR